MTLKKKEESKRRGTSIQQSGLVQRKNASILGSLPVSEESKASRSRSGSESKINPTGKNVQVVKTISSDVPKAETLAANPDQKPVLLLLKRDELLQFFIAKVQTIQKE